MSINNDFYYNYKRRFEKAIKEVREEERAWLLENLAKELLNALASEWLSNEEYEKEVGIKQNS